jgi:uncharacterized C2H2 Zn-finger protein
VDRARSRYDRDACSRCDALSGMKHSWSCFVLMSMSWEPAQADSISTSLKRRESVLVDPYFPVSHSEIQFT